MVLNLNTGKLSCQDLQVRLTPTEVKLLYMLMRNAGRPVSGAEIVREVWGQNDLDTTLAKACVLRIQKRLNDDPPHIILFDANGEYRFVPPTA
jgi:two-component system KDP operon response regulator KdpE